MKTPTKNRVHIFRATLVLLLIIPLVISVWKVQYLNFSPEKILPIPTWTVSLKMSAQGQAQKINIKSYIPQTDIRQKIQNFEVNKSDFTYSENQTKSNLSAKWSNNELSGEAEVGYQFEVQIQPQEFIVDPLIKRPPLEDNPHLNSTKLIQSKHQSISDKAKDLGIDTLEHTLDILKTSFRFVQDSIKATNFSGETDALLTLNLGEASCNGKSRLLTALLRSQGIPTRLVGGIIAESGTKTTAHQWTESYIQGHWVPMDPLNNHFLSIPINYLIYYKGDKSLFTRTINRNFQYEFEFQKKMATKFDFDTKDYHWAEVYPYLKSQGIPSEILKVLLMIPLGALITLMFRNVIGVSTFGTFLPALLAASFRDTGLAGGLIGLLLVLALGYLLRKFLDYFQLLHTPKLTFILTFLILTIIALTLIGVNFGIKSWTDVSLLPIVILTLTVERISIQIDESGLKATLKKLYHTTLVIIFCYLGMRSEFLKILFTAFPELLIGIMGLSLYFGRWDGLRVSEFFRFKTLLQKSPHDT